LLCIDVRLGVIDGKHLASKILQEHPDLPILFMSGYPMEYLVASGILDVNDTFLRKPFSPDDLLARISLILQKDRSHAVSA